MQELVDVRWLKLMLENMSLSQFVPLVFILIMTGCGRSSPTVRTLLLAGFSKTNVTVATVANTSDAPGTPARQVQPAQLTGFWQRMETAEAVSENHFLVATKYIITLQTNARSAGVALSIYIDEDGGACVEGGGLIRKHYFRCQALHDWVRETSGAGP